ncbi:CoA transferase [Bradyrhizobium sp. CB1717]|uniref:CaiB/BaiF CoA transferase family protein n=1 Tax=Bradyrhizobium sp. CB1717 TaxID=3039154 RepID=UPI0024B050AA|nr:CoA transferase [Bradyrhizobium sp. CB1717]WFU23217.1 CoA transferase [Bradyrhizobium sp. CB1717]
MDKDARSSLTGIRIIELTAMITGPLAGTMLADLGADVIKVENPPDGDPFRSFRGGNYSPYFCTYNRNKRSVVLNLKGEKGREAFLKLIETADVLIENFRAGVMDRLGLGVARLREVNPRLIICSITGFGDTGPYADRPAYDAVGQALSGISGLMLGAEGQITGPSVVDNLTGMYASYAVLGALFERERTGTARTIQLNMLESAIAFIADPFANYTMAGIKPDPLMRVRASQSYALRCSDGALLAIHMSSPTKFWVGVQKAFDRSDLGSDPRFESRAGRMENYEQLAQELGATAKTQERKYWIDRLVDNDVPHAPILTLQEVMDDAQVRHLDTFTEISHPVHGPHITIRRPVRYDGSRTDQPLNAAPDLNEHAAEVLGPLGYSTEAILELQRG